jgi:hypothetical protein
MSTSGLALRESLLDVSTSEDLALLGSSPHVDLSADLASWDSSD